MELNGTKLLACICIDSLEDLLHGLRAEIKQPVIQLASPICNAIATGDEGSDGPHHLRQLVTSQSRLVLLLRCLCWVQVGDGVCAAAGFAKGVDEGGEWLG